ncbi:carbohydrate ABC transporter permease [Blautia schinkii]|nr:carbohydrate ABC transporter permease [Blautia schinkii]
MGMYKKEKVWSIFRNVFVWCCVIICVYPVYWLVTTALKTRVDAFAVPPKWIFTPTLENIKAVLLQGTFMKSYRNSIIISVSTTLLAMILGIPMAYALARFKMQNKKGTMMWLLSTKMAPPILIAIPYYVIFKFLGMQDTYLGLIIVYLMFNLAFTVWMSRGFIEGVPIELEDAARIDGATRLRAFWAVDIPLIKGGVAATGILCFITVWNEFLLSLILSGYHTKTAPVTITSFISFEGIRWGEIAAAGILVAMPVIILGILVRKHLISGLTMGAVK